MVILVEEEPNLRSATAALLRGAGFPVTETDTTDRALQLVQASEASALVTDAHVLGEIDGWELANRTRSLRPQIAIVPMPAAEAGRILLSSYPDQTRALLQGSRLELRPNEGDVVELA